MYQELSRRHDLQPETWSAREIPDVVRDDGVASCSDRGLQHHVVLGIAEEWSPKEEDRLLMRKCAERIEHFGDVGPLEWAAADLAHESIFVLDDERHGDRDVERALLQLGDEPIRRTIARSQCGHQNVGVEDDARHFGMVSLIIPQCRAERTGTAPARL